MNFIKIMKKTQSTGLIKLIVGKHLFTFDKKKIYNLFKDYPQSLTKEEKEIFDKENPYWKAFFEDRNK